MENPLSDKEFTFRKAAEEFRKNSGLNQKEYDDLQATTLVDLQKCIVKIQQEQKLSRKLQNLRRLKPFLDAMRQYGDVAEVFVNVSNFVAFIWGPIKLLLIATSNMSEAFSALLDGYSMIGRSLPLFFGYQQLFKDNVHIQEHLMYIFYNILEFHAEAVKFFKKSTWRQLFPAVWRGFMPKIEHCCENLNNYKKLIEDESNLSHFEEERKRYLEAQQKFSVLISYERDRRRRELQTWLDAEEQHERRIGILGDRHPGTGTWLLEHESFKNWFNGQSGVDALLWLHGIPGSGKTVLAATVIEHAKSQHNLAVAFHFCRHTDNQQNKLAFVARSILSQLLAQDDDLLPFLSEEMSRSRTFCLSDEKLAKTLLDVALGSHPNICIIIDGLDEYADKDREKITTWFKARIARSSSQPKGMIRYLFVSQNDRPSQRAFSDIESIEVKHQHNSKDILRYCQVRHKAIETKHGIELTGKHDIARMSAAAAQGMFLFAKLSMNFYDLFESEYELKNEIESEYELKKGTESDKFLSEATELNELYSRILAKIIPSGSNLVLAQKKPIQLLGWLVCARRPFKWYEIQGAMMIDLKDGEVKPTRVLSRTCEDICRSLVEVKADQTVTLVHLTARRYLENSGHLNIMHIEAELATLSFAYLTWDLFELDQQTDKIWDNILQGRYSFMNYAVCFWPSHLKEALSKMEEFTEEFLELLELFIECRWHQTTKIYDASQAVKENLSLLREFEWFDELCQMITSHDTHFDEAIGSLSVDKEVSAIPAAVRMIRRLFERMVMDPRTTDQQKQRLIKFYGPNWFKCQRMGCMHFSDGFNDSQTRQNHHDKHERPFRCHITSCYRWIIGCVTSIELKRHLSNDHGIQSTTSKKTFPDDDISANLTDKKQTQKDSGYWKCRQCKRCFTRRHNLEYHLRTHNNERPYACEHCKKSFTGPTDLKKHSKIHTRTDFRCSGKLKDGYPWGCDKSFANEKHMMRHFKSKRGALCLRPLFDEETDEKRKMDQMRNKYSAFAPRTDASMLPGMQSTTFGGAFPISLYLQFPWLSDMADESSPDAPNSLHRVLKRARETDELLKIPRLPPPLRQSDEDSTDRFDRSDSSSREDTETSDAELQAA